MAIPSLIYKIEFSNLAKKQIRNISKKISEMLGNALVELSENPYLGYKLVGKYKGKMAYDFSYRYLVIYGMNKKRRKANRL